MEVPLPWLALFVRIHPYLYWLLLALQIVTLIPALRLAVHRAPDPPSDRPNADQPCLQEAILALGFLVFAAGLGLYLVVYPLLIRVRNDIGSLYWGLLFLLPLAWLAALDWLMQSPKLRWQPSGAGEDRRVFWAAWESAVFLSLLYYAIFFLRWGLPLAVGFGTREAALSLSWTVVCHLLVFMDVFAILFLVGTVARWFANPSKMEFVFCASLGCLGMAGTLRFLVFPLISFQGWRADIFALGAGIGLGGFGAGLSARLFPVENSSVESGLALAIDRFYHFHSPQCSLPRGAGLRSKLSWLIDVDNVNCPEYMYS